MHRVLHDGLGVFKLDRRQAALVITAVVAAVAGLRDGLQEGVDRVAGVGWVLIVGIAEVSRTHEAILADAFLAIEVMEHQDAFAQAGGSYLKSGAIAGK
jgi:hypothetical protein